MRPDDLVSHVDAYLAQGWSVLPLHTIGEDGLCTCRRPDCSSQGKHPIARLVPTGLKEASSDPAVINGWLRSVPTMNVGIATGEISGIAVIDVDTDHEGMETIDRLECRYGSLPTTRLVSTGSGGWHLYFAAPDKPLKNSASRIGTGIDVRADGGYVVAPPSLHRSGQRYEWSDEDAPLLSMPGWLLARAQADPIPMTRVRSFGSASRLSDRYSAPVGDGSRNVTLAKVAGSLRRRGLDEQSIADALLTHNSQYCSPPLSEREVIQVARSISRYPAGLAAR